jgi:hypothetical protein
MTGWPKVAPLAMNQEPIPDVQTAQEGPARPDKPARSKLRRPDIRVPCGDSIASM